MRNLLSLGIMAFCISLMSAVPAMADEGEGSTAPAEAVVQSNENDRICRRVHVTGSNIPQRVCMTRREWGELREESQEALRDNRDNAGANTTTVGSE